MRYLGRGESGVPKCGWRMTGDGQEGSPCKEEPVWGFAGDKQFRYLLFIEHGICEGAIWERSLKRIKKIIYNCCEK